MRHGGKFPNTYRYALVASCSDLAPVLLGVLFPSRARWDGSQPVPNPVPVPTVGCAPQHLLHPRVPSVTEPPRHPARPWLHFLHDKIQIWVKCSQGRDFSLEALCTGEPPQPEGEPKPARKGRRRLLRACPCAKRGRRRAKLAEEQRSRNRPGIRPGWELEAVSPTLDGTREPRPSWLSCQPRAGTPRGTVAAVRPWAPCRGRAPGVPWWGLVRAPSPSPVLLQSPGTCSAAPNR